MTVATAPPETTRQRKRREWEERKVRQRPDCARAPTEPSCVSGYTCTRTSTPPAVLPVAECGVCDQCSWLTIGGHCTHCQRQANARRAADEATYRPGRVRVVEHQDQDQASDDVAELTLPEYVSEPARQVAHVVATIATARLASGGSLDFALQKLAAGRDLIARQLAAYADLDGTTTAYDRKTVARALQELVDLEVLRRVGQLNEWHDEEEGAPRRGAYVYALNVTCRKLGQLARRTTAEASRPLHAAVRGM